jgi:hypothetical protein
MPIFSPLGEIRKGVFTLLNFVINCKVLEKRD